MVVYISEPKSFMGADILTKNTNLLGLQNSFQRLLRESKDLNKIGLLDRKFKPLKFKVQQMTKDIVMISIKHRAFFLEGVL